MTHEDNIRRKKRWGLKKRRSDTHLVEERGSRVVSDPPSLPASSNGSRGRFSGSISKLFGKVTNRSARSAQQSPNPDPTAASSSAPVLLHLQTSEVPSPLTTPTPDPNAEQPSDSRTTEAEHLDPKFVNERITSAAKGLTGIGLVPPIIQNASSAPDNLQSVSDTIYKSSALLEPLKAFNSIANGIADVHPFVKVALSILTCASKMILDQANRDDAVLSLLTKISAVYTLLTERDGFVRVVSMLEICGKIARQTLECADFVVHYSEMTNFWRRLGKHVFNQTEAAIQSYNDVLDNLMQQFRDQMALTTVETVHRIAEDLDVSGMEYVPGAGRNTSKNCLPGTREDILSELKCWIRSTGEDVQQVLWLSGTAGKGKSAIAHAIANWSHERGGMRACFCFDHTREAERRHEKIFTTIARNLADCDITMRGALARAVHDDIELKHTIDISRQWQELVVGPIGEASKAITAPAVIIIDALDESGDPKSREQILRLLSGKADTPSTQPTKLPANVRIIVTSRPLQDIRDALDASHVRHVSMDDILPASTHSDIQLYVSTKLAGLRNFDHTQFKTLAEKSDGLFEWARLACEYINDMNSIGLDPIGRFDAVVAGTSQKGTRLLDDMYVRILAAIMPKDAREESIPVFRSVMGQILASLEPLPMPALEAMRLHFPEGRNRYKVDRVIKPLGSLLTGITDSHYPIRPLHASFYDFLTDTSRSHDFFVDPKAVQGDLAFASLRAMDSEGGLRFNICSLENSYLPNSSVPDLEKRIRKCIPAELSYSCRFWGTHIGASSFESSLAKEVEAFFDGERLLWWLEALALMKSLRGWVYSLLSIADWVTGHVEFVNISDAARDTLRFVRTFAPTILHSTPHLYLSALPFAPTQSRIFRKFAAKFPRTPRIVSGYVANWPQMEKILHANDDVWSVAMSPDGKRIACGLDQGTIQVWDTETGEALCAPLQGHTHIVASVAFSPDGKHIVSGSYDHTVRVWDAVTGQALGSPLEGHTEFVTSVAISPNGNKIVSGSEDKTIRVWDMETGKAFGHPLEGHTDYVRSVAISQHGKHIVSGSRDKTIRVWDMETGEAFVLEGHTGYVQSVAISQDGKHIVSGSRDNTIRVWDLKTGEALGAPLQGHTASIQSVTISLDGNRIVSGSHDRTIRVWDLNTRQALGSPLQGHTRSVLSVAISPGGNRIVSGSDDRTVRVWGADTILGKASVAALQNHTDSVNSIAISPDGKCIVSGSGDRTVRVWDMATGEALVAPLQGHTGSVESVAISPDGKLIVSGSRDTTIWVWDMGTGEALGAPLQGHTTTAVDSVAISLDGNCIVSGSYDMIQVYNAAESGEVSCTPFQLQWGHLGGILSLAISPDRSFLFSGSRNGIIWIWNVETGRQSDSLFRGHNGSVQSVTVSPDAKCVVSGSTDMTVRVWDIETRKALYAPLQGHTGWVSSVAISQNGQHIVSGSTDETIWVWDMKTGEAVGAPFRGHTDDVMSVAISPDGKHVVSGSSDNTIRVWDLEFLHRQQLFEASAICFSHDPSHALHSASSFLSDSEAPAPYRPNEEGWVVGPEGRLLLWIPLNFHPVTYAQGNVLVIPNNALQLDLSRVAHGTLWHECRTQEAESSS